jgi:hypothetical protein
MMKVGHIDLAVIVSRKRSLHLCLAEVAASLKVRASALPMLAIDFI